MRLNPLQRTIFNDDHTAFRKAARDFADREVVPNLAVWEAQKSVDPQLLRKAGQMGLLGVDVPEHFGGGGIDDFRFSAAGTGHDGPRELRAGVRHTRPDRPLSTC